MERRGVVTVLILICCKQVQETGWVQSQQSPSPVEEMGDLVEAEAVCDSVQSHCSDSEGSLDTSTHLPQVKLWFAVASLCHNFHNFVVCDYCTDQLCHYSEFLILNPIVSKGYTASLPRRNLCCCKVSLAHHCVPIVSLEITKMYYEPRYRMQMILLWRRTRMWTHAYSAANKMHVSRKAITWICTFVSSVLCLQAVVIVDKLWRFHH